MTIVFRIGPERPRVDPALIERFRPIPTPNISDATCRMVAGGARLRPVGAANLIGPAFAVKTAPGDNLLVDKAIGTARPGDVIVVDAGGEVINAIIGERMVTTAAERGIAGFVINGAIRDFGALRVHPMPVFAAGVSHRGPYKNGPGEIHFPIAIDGMVIESGDLTVADEDGIVCVPLRDAEAVCVNAEAIAKREQTTKPFYDAERIDGALKSLGCEFPWD